MSILLSSIFATAEETITIDDNEKGWVNNEIRFNGVDWLNNSVYTTPAETQAYDVDGDSFSLAWNYSLNAAVNGNEYDYIEKNLEEPVIGGTFSMSVWIREGGGTDPNGYKFEILGFEPNGTEHKLTATETLSVSGTTPASGNDSGWHLVNANLPVNKKIIRIGIKMFNGNAKSTNWGVVNIDGIKFTNTVKAEYIRIGENDWTPVQRTTETPTVSNGTIQYYYEGDGVLVLSGGVTPDLDYLKTIAMEKTLQSAIKNGYLEYKVYLDAFNSSLNGSSHTKTTAACYDANGNKYELNGETRIKYSAFLAGGTVYAGYNQFRAKLPDDIEITKIEIFINWYENGGMGALPYYIDDIKVVGNDVAVVAPETEPETENNNPETSDELLSLVFVAVIAIAMVVFKKKKEYV